MTTNNRLETNHAHNFSCPQCGENFSSKALMQSHLFSLPMGHQQPATQNTDGWQLVDRALSAPSIDERVEARAELIAAVDEWERLRRMLSTVIDANYGTDYHHIGNGDGIPEPQAKEIADWWRGELERIQREYNEQKGGER